MFLENHFAQFKFSFHWFNWPNHSAESYWDL